MFKHQLFSKKGSLLVLALVSTVTASQFVCADQLNSGSSIDSHQRARNLIEGSSQIPALDHNIAAATNVDSHQSARNLIEGSTLIPALDHNIAAATYIDLHQRARNLIGGSAQVAPADVQAVK